MRDPKRIKRILKLIEKYWNLNQDQRFGQALINAGIVTDEMWVWQMEDDKLEEGLNDFFDKPK